MQPVWMPDRCLLGLSGADGRCRVRGAGWRERATGPRYPLRKVRCKTHGRSFTLYPVGHVPYGREPVICQVEDLEVAEEPRASLVGAAVAQCRGERWPEELIFDDPGPVRRTQGRRIARVGELVGFDGREVDSRVLGELGLGVVQVGGRLSERVAALSALGPGLEPWLRVVGAMDLVRRLGPVGVLAGVVRSPLTSARGSRVRSFRGPPLQPGSNGHESVLESCREGG
jgi:hypothetical protein